MTISISLFGDPAAKQQFINKLLSCSGLHSSFRTEDFLFDRDLSLYGERVCFYNYDKAAENTIYASYQLFFMASKFEPMPHGLRDGVIVSVPGYEYCQALYQVKPGMVIVPVGADFEDVLLLLRTAHSGNLSLYPSDRARQLFPEFVYPSHNLGLPELNESFFTQPMACRPRPKIDEGVTCRRGDSMNQSVRSMGSEASLPGSPMVRRRSSTVMADVPLYCDELSKDSYQELLASQQCQETPGELWVRKDERGRGGMRLDRLIVLMRRRLIKEGKLLPDGSIPNGRLASVDGSLSASQRSELFPSLSGSGSTTASPLASSRSARPSMVSFTDGSAEGLPTMVPRPPAPSSDATSGSSPFANTTHHTSTVGPLPTLGPRRVVSFHFPKPNETNDNEN